MTLAVGTSLLVIALTSAAALAAHLATGTINLPLSAAFTLAAIAGAVAGRGCTARSLNRYCAALRTAARRRRNIRLAKNAGGRLASTQARPNAGKQRKNPRYGFFVYRDHPASPHRQRSIPRTSRRRSPEAPAGARQSPQARVAKSPAHAGNPRPLPAQPGITKTACHAGGRGFESRRSRKRPPNRHLWLSGKARTTAGLLFIPRTSRTGIVARSRS